MDFIHFRSKGVKVHQASCDLTLRVAWRNPLQMWNNSPCHVGRIKFILEYSPKMNFKGKNSQTMYVVFLKVWCLGWRKLKRPPTQLQFSLAVVLKILAAFEQTQYSILSCLQSLFSSLFIMSINEWWVCIFELYYVYDLVWSCKHISWSCM